MTLFKTKNILMLSSARGAPEGHTVVEYAKDWSGKLPVTLADAFIESGAAKELPSDEGVMVVPSWPPTDEQIEALSFSALGVLLEQKEVPLGPLKSEDARRDALRDVIASEFIPPWPAYTGGGRISDNVLARKLKAAGVDIETLKTRDDAEAKLREIMGIQPDEDFLRDDGPTLTEFVKVGYSAVAYPPRGYSPKPLTDEEKTILEKAKADAKAEADRLERLGEVKWPPTEAQMPDLSREQLDQMLADHAPGFTGTHDEARAKVAELAKAARETLAQQQ